MKTPLIEQTKALNHLNQFLSRYFSRCTHHIPVRLFFFLLFLLLLCSFCS